MGKGKRKRNRRRSQAAKEVAKFASYDLESWMEKAEKGENEKEHQLDYLKRVAQLEKDIISRTILVSGVKDLKRTTNLRNLEIFFVQNYGPVEACFVSSFGGKGSKNNSFPPARVRFSREKDLLRVLGDCDNNLLICPTVGFIDNGTKIKVVRSHHYQDMTKEILSGSVVQFTASGVALGHWTPDDIMNGCFHESHTEDGQWLEETKLSDHELSIKIDLPKRMIEMTCQKPMFSPGTSFFDSMTEYHASFRFKEFDGFIDLCRDEAYDYSLIFSSKYPPRLESFNPVMDLHLDDRKSRKRDDVFGDVAAEDFGRCLGFRISLPKSGVETLLLNAGFDELKKFGLFRMDLSNLRHARKINNRVIGKNDARAKRKLQELHQEDALLGFTLLSVMNESKFSWYHALQNTYTGSWGKTDDIFTIVRKFDRFVAQQTLEQIGMASGKTKYPCALFLKLVDNEAEPNEIPEHCVSIPRLYLTPSRQRANFFEVETSNRVVRNFVNEHGFEMDAFLRVHICDENGQSLFSNDLRGKMEERVLNHIVSGLKINGKHYFFLAFSSSQLKEASLWMVAPKEGWTVSKMREHMGDFSMCTSPSKFAARIGQCFSTTFQGLCGADAPSNSPENLGHVVIHDVMTVHENLFHSDGNGLITKDALRRLLKSLPNVPPRVLQNTSVVQIRYGGAKGILVAWEPEVINRVSAQNGIFGSSYSVFLRPSMIKFDAKFSFLEVCRIGTQVSSYLNRNVILLLGCHAVRDDIFLSMQQEMLDELNLMLEDRRVAIKLVTHLGGPDSSQRMRLLRCLFCGLTPSKDPFLLSCLLAIRSHHHFGLRKKARIFVEKGAVLIGGIDETKLLPENCVFLQIRKTSGSIFSDEDDIFEPIVGPVLVTKHPVMHPGDVRMLLAVDIPELRSLKNVIIFSQKGARPEPDKMAGSDVDGDEFFCTWDSRLFLGEWNEVSKDDSGNFVSKSGRMISLRNYAMDAQNLQYSNHTPMDYSPPAREPESLSTDDQGLVKHFINYVKNDCLGRIGMLWQDWAARKGADCEECIELAKQHSIAVDFAKSGVPAEIPDFVMWRGPRAHWREKKGESEYKCESSIGKLYDQLLHQSDQKIVRKFRYGIAGRKIDRYGQVLSLMEHDTNKYLRVIYQPQIPTKLGLSLEDVSGPEEKYKEESMREFAKEQRFLYEEQVMQIMNKYHLRNEGELFTGCIRKYHKLHKKRQHEIAEEVRRQCRELCNEYRESFFYEVKNMGTELFDLDISDLRDTAYTSLYVYFSNESGTQDEEDGEDGEDEDKMIVTWIEKVTTDSKFMEQMDPISQSVRSIARQLAASYYVASYSPYRLRNNNIALFSFPWLVADVIAFGLRDGE